MRKCRLAGRSLLVGLMMLGLGVQNLAAAQITDDRGAAVTLAVPAPADHLPVRRLDGNLEHLRGGRPGGGLYSGR